MTPAEGREKDFQAAWYVLKKAKIKAGQIQSFSLGKKHYGLLAHTSLCISYLCSMEPTYTETC